MFQFPGINVPEIEIPTAPIAYSYSDTQFEILCKYIKDFEKTLDDEHEVGLLLTNFGQSVTMQVTNVSYEQSVLMVFKGYVNGKMSTLIVFLILCLCPSILFQRPGVGRAHKPL